MSILEKHPAAAQRIQQGLAIDAKRIEYYVNGRLLLGVDLERQQYRLVSDSELERTFHGPVQLVEMYCNGVLVYLEIGEEQIFAAPNLDAIDELLPYYLCYQLNWTRHL
ncbi:MAG: hypothetical protein NZ482_01905 [Gloeomargarita sp. SKYG98]|nr:hypothetical protein [Gloeomargarita sp. SKYG98]